jgi:hypothetical protein
LELIHDAPNDEYKIVIVQVSNLGVYYLPLPVPIQHPAVYLYDIFTFSVCLLQKGEIVSLHNINQLVFLIKVRCPVRQEFCYRV